MRYLSLLCILAVLLKLITPVSNISGKYYSEDFFEEIIINGDIFQYVVHQGTAPIFHNDTLAEAKIQRIDECWAEINSESKVLEAFASKYVEEVLDLLQDSIVVSFEIPSKSDYSGALYFNPDSSRLGFLKSKKIKITQGHGTVAFGKSEIERIHSLWIEPEMYAYSIDIPLIRGLAFENFPLLINIKNSFNTYTIFIPFFDDRYFERQYIKGEFIKIQNDTLRWRGINYIKGQHYYHSPIGLI